ncbi:MAG: hypothetical protein JEZ07_03535 [Phycisphaerae bacterium]|nr:hypothetical protein [Phycisphaerae bacterium]
MSHNYTLPGRTPKLIKEYGREAISCLDAECPRGAAALLRRALELIAADNPQDGDNLRAKRRRVPAT